MEDFVAGLEKAELHLHLEGSVEPETVREIVPEFSISDIRAQYEFTDFLGFLQSFKWLVERLNTHEHYALITRRLLDRLASQNVRYAEITLSAGVVLWRGLDFGAIFEAVQAEAEKSPVKVRWILDAIRHFGADHARQVLELAAARVGQGVVAFGIGGDEVRGPASLFRDVYREAREAGLRLTAHAGEAAGPESIWEALEIGAERIGHGIAAVKDPVLMAHLRDREIPLEVCITSNVVTGVVASLPDHPVRKLYDAGVPIVLNTDDPAFFKTSLDEEYRIAMAVFGFGESEMRRLTANAFRFAFK